MHFGINTRINIFQAVNEGEVNPGIRYSYKLPKVDSKFQSNTSQSRTEDENMKITEIEKTLKKPSNIRVSTSHLPSRRNYGQTNVRVVDRRRGPVNNNDFSRYNRKRVNSNENQKQFVYQNAIQVLGGANSITNNVYDKSGKELSKNNSEEVTTKRPTEATTDGAIGEEGFRSYIANEIKYRTNDNGEDRMELESRGPGTSSVEYGNQRYMWSHGQWTECSNKCGAGEIENLNVISCFLYGLICQFQCQHLWSYFSSQST
jgi:hypothetical protein